MSLPDPYYSDEAVTIYHGDCREILPHLLEPVDSVVTDPPYGIGFADYLSHKDRPDEYGEILDAIFKAESLVRDGWCVVWQSETTMARWGEWFPRQWFPVAMPKTFTQIHATGGRVCSTDYAIVWSVGAPSWPSRKERPRNWFICQTSNMALRQKGHPCPRPLDGVAFVVNGWVRPGGVALDPFMGSGTTLRAAKDLGRRAIGIESEERYCEIAAKRMSQEVLPL